MKTTPMGVESFKLSDVPKIDSSITDASEAPTTNLTEEILRADEREGIDFGVAERMEMELKDGIELPGNPDGGMQLTETVITHENPTELPLTAKPLDTSPEAFVAMIGGKPKVDKEGNVVKDEYGRTQYEFDYQDPDYRLAAQLLSPSRRGNMYARSTDIKDIWTGHVPEQPKRILAVAEHFYGGLPSIDEADKVAGAVVDILDAVYGDKPWSKIPVEGYSIPAGEVPAITQNILELYENSFRQVQYANETEKLDHRREFVNKVGIALIGSNEPGLYLEVVDALYSADNTDLNSDIDPSKLSTAKSGAVRRLLVPDLQFWDDKRVDTHPGATARRMASKEGRAVFDAQVLQSDKLPDSFRQEYEKMILDEEEAKRQRAYETVGDFPPMEQIAQEALEEDPELTPDQLRQQVTTAGVRNLVQATLGHLAQPLGPQGYLKQLSEMDHWPRRLQDGESLAGFEAAKTFSVKNIGPDEQLGTHGMRVTRRQQVAALITNGARDLISHISMKSGEKKFKAARDVLMHFSDMRPLVTFLEEVQELPDETREPALKAMVEVFGIDSSKLSKAAIDEFVGDLQQAQDFAKRTLTNARQPLPEGLDESNDPAAVAAVALYLHGGVKYTQKRAAELAQRVGKKEVT